jgi:hypothetical protein
MARPTKYRPEMDSRVLELMRVGASLYEVAADLGIRARTLWTWEREGKWPTLNQALEEGRDASRAWWERQGRLNLENRSWQTGLWVVNMANRFNWHNASQRHEVTGPGGGAIEHEHRHRLDVDALDEGQQAQLWELLAVAGGGDSVIDPGEPAKRIESTCVT